MGKYNFDEIINRYNTNSLKWDYAEKRGKPKDILPLWVADMDFRCPNEVIDTLINKSKHGICGYSEPLDSYFEVVEEFAQSRLSSRPLTTLVWCRGFESTNRF